MPASYFSSYIRNCGEVGHPKVLQTVGTTAEFSSVHKKLLVALRNPTSPSAQKKYWLMSIATTDDDRKQTWANVVAAYRFCGWGLGMFCLPTSVVTGLPQNLSAIIRRFADGTTLDGLRRGDDDDDGVDSVVRAIEPFSPQQLSSLYLANLLVTNPDLNLGNLIVFNAKTSRLPVLNSSQFAVFDFDFALGALNATCATRAFYDNLRPDNAYVPCTGKDFRDIPAARWGEYQKSANAFFHLLVRRSSMQMPLCIDAEKAVDAALDTACTADFVQRVTDPRVIRKGNGLDVFYGLVPDKSHVEDRAKHLPHSRRLEWFAELAESRNCVTPRMMMRTLAEKEFLS